MSDGKLRRPKYTNHPRLINTLVYLSEEDVDTFLPLNYHKIVEVLEQNTKHHLRVCGYSVAELYGIGFTSVRHYLHAGYTVRDLVEDEALLYGMLCVFSHIEVAGMVRCADDAVVIAGTNAAHEVGFELHHLLSLCTGNPDAAHTVIQRTIHGDPDRLHGTTPEQLQDCCIGAEGVDGVAKVVQEKLSAFAPMRV